MGARGGAEGLHEAGKLLVLRGLVLAGGSDVEDFPPQRQHRLRGAVARLLGRAAGRVAFDDEDLGALRRGIGAVGELAGEAKLPPRGLARDLLLLPPADALVAAPAPELPHLVRFPP